mmetsp:Transcript_114149/g.323816  ORF Transcript_114149/g.323816 Transcript_114149/m.323816 type:complete len:207 (+) Transcript_114149:126-746(+)
MRQQQRRPGLTLGGTPDQAPSQWRPRCGLRAVHCRADVREDVGGPGRRRRAHRAARRARVELPGEFRVQQGQAPRHSEPQGRQGSGEGQRVHLKGRRRHREFPAWPHGEVRSGRRGHDGGASWPHLHFYSWLCFWRRGVQGREGTRACHYGESRNLLGHGHLQIAARREPVVLAFATGELLRGCHGGRLCGGSTLRTRGHWNWRSH